MFWQASKKIVYFAFISLFSFQATAYSAPKPNPLVSDESFAWMDEQIEKDFANVQPFSKKVIVKEVQRIQLKHKFYKLYQIRDGIVYGPQSNIKAFLDKLLQLYDVPDCTFVYYREDIIRSKKYDSLKINFPILVSAKDDESDGKIIHFIDWYYLLDKQKGWDSMLPQVEAARNEVAWEDKIPKLFWRGAPTDPKGLNLPDINELGRGHLVLKSLKSPDLIDAIFNRVFNLKSQGHFPIGNSASISEHMKYKYQIAMDGVTATYPGYQWRLHSQCLTIKQESTDTMWYYGALKPYVHYVPVAKNLEGLEDLILWLRDNDDIARQIAENAYEFTKNNLMPEHMYLYAYKVLCKYAQKQMP